MRTHLRQFLVFEIPFLFSGCKRAVLSKKDHKFVSIDNDNASANMHASLLDKMFILGAF